MLDQKREAEAEGWYPQITHIDKRGTRYDSSPANHTRPTNHGALLTKPAFWLSPALKHDCIALQTIGKVVPRGGDQLVLAAEILNFLLKFSLFFWGRLRLACAPSVRS